MTAGKGASEHTDKEKIPVLVRILVGLGMLGITLPATSLPSDFRLACSWTESPSLQPLRSFVSPKASSTATWIWRVVIEGKAQVWGTGVMPPMPTFPLTSHASRFARVV